MTKAPWFPRVVPFAVYMLFILLFDLLVKMIPETSPAAEHLTAIVYPVKIIAVIIALKIFWTDYDEIKWKGSETPHLITALVIGVLVFVLWIQMDWDFATMGEQTSYDPTTLPKGLFAAFVIVRLFGASVIVPIFEELFWRSFILRYIVNPDFHTVRIATFTWASFIISSLLFGAEHHLWLAGIVAGALYNILLYKTKHINYCIMAHGITNFLLGIYVLQTEEWHFW